MTEAKSDWQLSGKSAIVAQRRVNWSFNEGSSKHNRILVL